MPHHWFELTKVERPKIRSLDTQIILGEPSSKIIIPTTKLDINWLLKMLTVMFA